MNNHNDLAGVPPIATRIEAGTGRCHALASATESEGPLSPVNKIKGFRYV